MAREWHLLHREPAHQLHQYLRQPLPILRFLSKRGGAGRFPAANRGMPGEGRVVPRGPGERVPHRGGLPSIARPRLLHRVAVRAPRGFPEVHLQAFTAVEVAHIAQVAGITVHECLERLREAGLGSLPGGGAEVFSSRVREALCPRKLPAEEWLEVIRAAHSLGLRSNCTLLYGHIERAEEVVDHLLRLRALQDETRGFLAFIPLAFHSGHTELKGEIAGPTAWESLRLFAVSRLLLDNIPHLKVFWIMLGLKLAQVALSFGADDVDGTVVEERITHAAGAETPEALTVEELKQLIQGAGRQPIARDTVYRPVREEVS